MAGMGAGDQGGLPGGGILADTCEAGSRVGGACRTSG